MKRFPRVSGVQLESLISSVKDLLPDLGEGFIEVSTLLVISFCRLLITFANKLDPDQARQNVGPDLDPICLTLR